MFQLIKGACKITGVFSAVVILTIFHLGSCRAQKEKAIDTQFQVLLPGTAQPHNPDTSFEFLKGLSRKFNLPKLDTGVAGITLRLWISSPIIPHTLVTVIIGDTSVTAQKFDYYIEGNGVAHFQPSAGRYGADSLQLLVNKLNAVDFPSMISQSDIENFNDNIADGAKYYLEVSTPEYYKLLIYHCPEYFAKREPNNKKFLDLILMLDRHLHFYSPLCPPD
ncbi:MAG: hypothetical protein JWQ27_3176 [Ferruginibacter sp.]|nr:hypothetical protein [Ferruginibacter sp.]